MPKSINVFLIGRMDLSGVLLGMAPKNIVPRRHVIFFQDIGFCA